MYDIQEIRKDFPILEREVYGRPLVYLDNGATTQKPRCVVEAMTDEYYNVNANVHRGVHFLSQQATELHEAARETVRRFLNARSPAEIVFTRGTTESINLVASCFGEAFMRKGDEVILSEMEHHSNIVSWQLLQARKGIKLRVVPINDRGELMLDEYERLFNDRTRIVSVTHVSNVLGTVNPVRRMIDIAHAHGVPVLVDGAQSTPHFAVDMQSLDADFFAFSGHKIYGPTGVGVLYGKETWLDRLPPYMGGGEMIRHVTFEHTTFNGLPFKFEAGTPDYVATTGLARALDYVSALGMDNIYAHEQELTRYALERMRRVPGMRILGEAEERDAVISFLVGGIHHLHELGVDALREVCVVLKGRADLFQLQAVHILHHGHAVGVAHTDAGHMPRFAVRGQFFVHKRFFAHVHSRQAGRHGTVSAHLHLPQLCALSADALDTAVGVDGQDRLFHPVGVEPLGHTAHAIAAHLGLAAVCVEDTHPAIGPGGHRGADADDAVRTHGKMPGREPLCKCGNVCGHTGCTAVQIDVIIGTALHLGK